MNWIALNSIDQLDTIVQESQEKPVLIFKHSTTCNISRTSLDRLQRHYKAEEMADVKTYFLDLLNNRPVSNAIATRFEVQHESPQALIIKGGKAIYHASHFEIDFRQLATQAK